MQFAFQLYSARRTPIDRALRIVADAGYTAVESFAENFADPDALRRALDETGLQMPSMHVHLADLRNDAEAHRRRAREFGVANIVCPFLAEDQRPGDVAGWKALAAELEGMARRWSAEGFAFAYHNHDFELRALPGGEVPLRLLFDAAPSLRWEIDAAWLARAGEAPEAWIDELGERIGVAHLKDIAAPGECADEAGWADVGEGTMNWGELLGKLRATPATLFVMEHDEPSDLERFATRSIRNARAMASGDA